MPRVARVDIGDTVYHVINRAVGRLRIFDTEKDYALFNALLAEGVERFDIRLLSYVLMPNHWHLQLYPKKDGDLGLFMHWLTNTHTRKVHSKTNTIGTGPLYQGRYKSFIAQDDLHALTVLKYIERNPVRAHMTKRVEDWQWGSAWVRTHGNEKEKLLLALPPMELPRSYLDWVNSPELPETLKVLRTSVVKSAPFGQDRWVEHMVKSYDLGSTLKSVGRPKKIQ